ncbi:MAG: porphobilinogen synthase [Steroidobacteraceae bacterium]
MLDRVASPSSASRDAVAPPRRLQRLRRTAPLRDLVAETGFTQSQLIQPLFIVEDPASAGPIPGLPGNARHSSDAALAQLDRDLDAGVRQFILFPVPARKHAHDFDPGSICEAIARLHRRAGKDATLWLDTCLCSYTADGHCCLHDARGEQDLPATLDALAGLALAYASAGADGIAPSDMNDGRVAALRLALDAAGHDLAPIMSYSAKFASQLYGPFRGAANSAPTHGDRRRYQIDVRARRDALASSQRCAAEGADLLMVKPGMSSLDLIHPIARATGLAVGAYQVSGEYAALALLAREGFADFDAALLESWYALRRGGAAFIITYGARLGRGLGLAAR